jgi:hypothetical protein
MHARVQGMWCVFVHPCLCCPVWGSFGAMLRSAGKTGNQKKILTFGACRDLHGRRYVSHLKHGIDPVIYMHVVTCVRASPCAPASRRGLRLWLCPSPNPLHLPPPPACPCSLRHVNDEIRLRKWLSEAEQKKREDMGDQYRCVCARARACACTAQCSTVVTCLLFAQGSQGRSRHGGLVLGCACLVCSITASATAAARTVCTCHRPLSLIRLCPRVCLWGAPVQGGGL